MFHSLKIVLMSTTKLPTLKQKLYHTFAPRLKIEMMIVSSLLHPLLCTLPQDWRFGNGDWWGFWPIWFLWFHFVNWLSTLVKTISSPLPPRLQLSRQRGRFQKYDWSMWLHSIGLILARIVKPISSQSTLISAVGSMTTLNPCSWMRFISTCQWFAYNESWIL